MPTLFQINSVVNTGSTGRIAEQIGEFVISKGWESYIAYGRINKGSISKTVKIGKKTDILLHGIQTRLLDRHGLGSGKATRKLISTIQNIRPDIIHLHNIHGYYINYPKLFEYLTKTNIPIVWTLHDCWAMTGHCVHFSQINCYKWRIKCHFCPKKKDYPASYFIDRSIKNYFLKKHTFTSLNNLTIIPVSRWLESVVKESFLGKYTTCVINNGIDVNAFFPSSDGSLLRKKYKIENRFVLMGVATSWDARKGWNDFCKLSQLLSDEYVIILLGVTKIQKRKLPVSIIGIERTESIYELSELYSSADIILNLSYTESFGMTTVEGFSCGTPSIVYNNTASPELVTQRTGLIVEPGNLRQLVQAIEEIKLNRKQYYSEYCRARRGWGHSFSLQLEFPIP